MKVIDMSIFQKSLDNLEDLSYVLEIDNQIPKISEMSILEASKLIEQNNPMFIDTLVNRCQERCGEDDWLHDIEQLKRKLDTARTDSKSIIWFEGVF